MSNLRLDQAVEIKAELEALTYAELKAKFAELGIESVWKAGVKKSVLIQSAMKALEEAPEPIAEEIPAEEIEEEESEEEEIPAEEIEEEESEEEEIPAEEIEEEESEEEEIPAEEIEVVEEKILTDQKADSEELPEGEYELDEEAFVEYPKLVQMGFVVGDTLVVEAGKPWSKKEIEKEEESYTHTLEVDLNKGEIYAEGPVDLDDEEAEEEVEEIAPAEEVEVIDEDKYTEAEILENIELVQCNMIQAIPTTRNLLLRKLDALQKALDRKQAK